MNGSRALEAARAHRERAGWRILNDYMALLAIPNVTGEVKDLRTNAGEIAGRFSARGAAMEVVEIEGAAPVVIGELRCPSPTATIGVYVHYDGQPVDSDNWTTSPFEPVLTDRPWHEGGAKLSTSSSGGSIDPEWRLYARSASDDKTPFSAITAAIDALDDAGIDRTVDLVFLFEGEEESGSPNLGRYMERLGERLSADAWLLCDGPVHQSRSPQVAFGARGYTGFDLTFYGPERELHSGHYGNWVPNPALELAQFLAGCKDSSGRVTIEGFYDDTAPMSEADRTAIAALPDIEDLLADELGFAAPEAEGSSYAERLMIPSFNVRGIRSAEIGEGARNVVPAQATASVDMRLAAGDDPESMLDRVEAHLARHGYRVMDREPTAEERRAHRKLCRMVRDVGYRAVRIPMESALANELTEACGVASGERVVALPTFGGSIPLYLFEDLLGSPVAVLPIANHDNNQHAADENLRVANLWYGIDLWAVLLAADFTAMQDQLRD